MAKNVKGRERKVEGGCQVWSRPAALDPQGTGGHSFLPSLLEHDIELICAYPTFQSEMNS
jgi:hypothetical protein